METELIKDRSLSSCIKTANNLLGINFAKTIKGTWLPALLFAIMTALFGFFALQEISATSLGSPSPTILSYVRSIGTWVVSLGLWAYFFASVITLVSESGLKQNLRRSLAIVGVELIVYLILMAIGIVVVRMVVMSHLGKPFTPNFITLVCGVTVAWLLLMALIMVPFKYAEMRYLLSPNGSLRRNLIAYYVSGVRGGGLLIGTTFFTVLASVCLGAIILLGELTMNDPSGLPPYFNALLIGSIVLTTFIFMIVVAWSVFVFYYVYGSIEHRRQMKKQKQAATAE